MSFVIYGHKQSTCTQRILFTIAESNSQSDIVFHKVDIFTGQHKSLEHLARQPFGKVPAAEFEGIPFYESRAICRLLAEKQRSPLLPTDLKKKAVFEQWASLESNTFGPQIDPIMWEVVFKVRRGMSTDQEALKKAREAITKTLEVFNEQLGKVDYIAGDFSLVDIFQASNWQHLQDTEVGKEILASYPNIAAWWKRLSARPGWNSVLAQAPGWQNVSAEVNTAQ